MKNEIQYTGTITNIINKRHQHGISWQTFPCDDNIIPGIVLNI